MNNQSFLLNVPVLAVNDQARIKIYPKLNIFMVLLSSIRTNEQYSVILLILSGFIYLDLYYKNAHGNKKEGKSASILQFLFYPHYYLHRKFLLYPWFLQEWIKNRATSRVGHLETYFQ